MPLTPFVFCLLLISFPKVITHRHFSFKKTLIRLSLYEHISSTIIPKKVLIHLSPQYPYYIYLFLMYISYMSRLQMSVSKSSLPLTTIFSRSMSLISLQKLSIFHTRIFPTGISTTYISPAALSCDHLLSRCLSYPYLKKKNSSTTINQYLISFEHLSHKSIFNECLFYPNVFRTNNSSSCYHPVKLSLTSILYLFTRRPISSHNYHMNISFTLISPKISRNCLTVSPRSILSSLSRISSSLILQLSYRHLNHALLINTSFKSISPTLSSTGIFLTTVLQVSFP